jgi:hypothetical protein
MLLRLSFIALLLISPAAGQSKRLGYAVTKPDQVIEIADAAAKFSVANRPCASYRWAAAVESMLRAYDLPWTQQQLVTSTFGGDKCLTEMKDAVSVSRRLEREYTLENSRRVRLRTEHLPGPPTVDRVGAHLRGGHPLMLLWQGRIYLLAGITYDEIYPDEKQPYHRFLAIRQLRLIDPSIAPDNPGRMVIFERDKRDPATIAGVLAITVQELKLGQLSEGYPQP